MFVANGLFSSKGKLTKIWVAAHWREPRKMRKNEVETNVKEAVSEIMATEKECALRIISQLLCGLARIHLRQVELLYFASINALGQLTPRASVKALKIKRPRVSGKRHVLEKRLALKALTAGRSSDEDEIIMRSSQQAMGRAEDITLPEAALSSPLKMAKRSPDGFDPLLPLDASGDFMPDLAVDGSFDMDASIEMPRSAVAQLPEIEEQTVPGRSAAKEVLAETKRTAPPQKRKKLIFVDRPVKLRRSEFAAHSKSFVWPLEESVLPIDALKTPFSLPQSALKLYINQIYNSENKTPKMDGAENLEESSLTFDFQDDLGAAANGVRALSISPLNLSLEGDSPDRIELDSSGIQDKSSANSISVDAGNVRDGKRAQKVLERVKELSDKTGEASLEDIVGAASRKTAASVFYELLCLQSQSLLRCRQEGLMGRVVAAMN